MHTEDEGINRREAIRKTAIGAATAGVIWSAPQVKGLHLRPAYAAAASGPMTFNFMLDGAQAGTASAGTGNGTVVVDPGTGQINYNIDWTGLQATVTVAHIHQAAAGSNGGVVLGLTVTDSNTTGGAQMGVDTNAALAALICATPSDYYVNVHTGAFPGGEIRGQLA